MRSSFATILSVALFASAVSAQSIAFSGDVPTDFAGATYFVDPQGDVGIPANFPAGTVSGWDLDGVAVSYDAATDTLFVGFDSRGIFGDADGDGDAGVSRPELLANGGIDHPDLGFSEAFTFSMDLNNDGTPDVIAGVGINGDISTFSVNMFAGSLFASFAAFGAPLPAFTGMVHTSPNAGAPDLEFTIVNFAQLVGMFSQPGQSNIGFHAFAGSLDDDGVGEDFLPGAGQLLPFPNPINAKLGNFVFVDGNCNGVQDAGEAGIASVTVNLYDPSDLSTPVATTMTGPNGEYEFCVDPGSYVVGFGIVAGHYYTNAGVGTDPSLDSDAGQDGLTGVITLGPTQVNATIDAGYCVCTGVAASVTPLGAGCGLALDPIMSADHPPFLGSTVRVTSLSAFPGALVFPFISFGAVTPTPIGGTGCMVYVDVADASNLFMIGVYQNDAMGTWEFDWDIPNDPSLSGLELTVQLRLCAPNGPVGPLTPDWATNGLRFRIGCP